MAESRYGHIILVRLIEHNSELSKKMCEHLIYGFVLSPPAVQSTIRLYVASAAENYSRHKV